MTREEHLEFCSVCTKRSFHPKSGVICSITNEVATFNGSCQDYQEDEKEVILEKQKISSQKSEVNKEINKGRMALFIIGGLYVLVGIYEGFFIAGHQLLFGIIDWFAAAVFIGLGVYSYYKASLALVIGLCFYILIMLCLAMIDPGTIIRGIIWKILIIYYLITAIKTARTEEAKTKVIPSDVLDQI